MFEVIRMTISGKTGNSSPTGDRCQVGIKETRQNDVTAITFATGGAADPLSAVHRRALAAYLREFPSSEVRRNHLVWPV